MTENSEFLEAAKNGDVATVVSLLDADPQLVSAAGDHDKTALHWAAEKDHAEIAQTLIEAGADIEARTSWGATPLEWAAVMGSGSVADLLLEKGAGGFTLVTAAALGKLSDVKKFAQQLTGTGGNNFSDALHSAARNGHRETVAYLLGLGGDIDTKGFFGATGMHWAAINGHHETVEFLLAQGADTSVRDSEFDATPEDWALEGGHNSIVEMLRRSAQPS